MKNLLLLLTCLWITSTASSQVFAFVKNDAGSNAAETVGGYKFAVANRVFSDLLRARGEYRMQAPSLVMSKRERYVAWMDPENVQIGLEEKAYDICVSFGADSINALAALLGHELTHYYEKHDWNRHFARENEDIEASQQLERLEEGLKHEAQADYLGGFLAFSVGYNTYGIMPTLLKKVYASYGLPDKLPGYPTLGDRLEMVNGAMKRLKELRVMFEISQFMSILGNYETAATYHQSILKSYQSREIFNNAGVNTMLAAMAYFSPKELPYILPLELDPNSRLRGMRSVEADRLEKRKTMLKTAIQLFDQAIVLDENYALGLLNKGCALVLAGDYEEAEYILKKAMKRSKDPVLNTDIMVMEGISAALQGNTEQAAQQLQKAKEEGARLASANLDIVRNTLSLQAIPSNRSVIGVEQIEQYNLANFLANPSVEQEINVAANILCGMQQRAASRIFIHYADNGKQYTVLQETDPNYQGSSLQGIHLKSTAQELQQAYGTPKSTVVLPDCIVWLYPEAKIYFKVNNQGVVAAWGVYTQP